MFSTLLFNSSRRFVGIPLGIFHRCKGYKCPTINVPLRSLSDEKGPIRSSAAAWKDVDATNEPNGEGSHCVSDVRDGVRCENGECWDELGHYNGEWVAGVKEGRGILHYKNGIVYEGGFLGNHPGGIGKLTWTDGSIYEGKFCHGILHDEHRLVSVSGLCYEGALKDGIPDGRGKLKSACGIVGEGTFKQGKLCGWSKSVTSDGACMEGMFVDGAWHGIVKTTYSAGDTAEGSYLRGEKHGLWIYHLYTGNQELNIIEGHYHHDRKWPTARPLMWIFKGFSCYGGDV